MTEDDGLARLLERQHADMKVVAEELRSEDRTIRQLVEFQKSDALRLANEQGKHEERLTKLEADVTEGLSAMRSEFREWREGFLGELRGRETERVVAERRFRLTAGVFGFVLVVLQIVDFAQKGTA